MGSGSKAAMTPKLYDEVQTKLGGVWGDRAGWAHSVSHKDMHTYQHSNTQQVLFTADLKSFSTYGLPTPSPSVSPEKTHGKEKEKAGLSTADLASSPVRLAKRKHTMGKLETKIIDEKMDSLVQQGNHGGLADRVKRRRREVPVDCYVE